MKSPAVLPRGLRNCNPFNIRRHPANDWLGEVQPLKVTDQEFEQFIALKYGFRAGVKLLCNYFRKGINTPYKIAQRFAPEEDRNDPRRYSVFLAKCLGLKCVHDQLTPNPKTLRDLAVSITICENGMDLFKEDDGYVALCRRELDLAIYMLTDYINQTQELCGKLF